MAENRELGEEPTGHASLLVPEWLISLLVCPVDRGTLRIEGEVLVCGNCGRTYEVRDGSPVMIPDDYPGEQTF